MKRLFTERHTGMKSRVGEQLNGPCRQGLLSLVGARISEEWFGEAFPDVCEDGQENSGTNFNKLYDMMDAYHVIRPDEWSRAEQPPSDGQVFELIEFTYEYIAEPRIVGEPHWYRGHSHYTYDQQEGRRKYEEQVNRLFERNGMAFEMKEGEVIRMAPTGFQEALAETVFCTGDSFLDDLLETARQKILNRELKVRRESLEKLWDAWERLKTVEPGKDKKAQATALLEKASDNPSLQEQLQKEARELTEIGNKFMIRHSETNKVPITESRHVDYLFHRMFAFIRLLLRSSGRGG